MAGMHWICFATFLFATVTGTAAEPPFPDAVELSGKWQPVIWGTPENPKPGRPKNVSGDELAALPDEITVSAGEAEKFTHWQWGDCRLQFEASGGAEILLLDRYRVYPPAKAGSGEWTRVEVRFVAPRWKDGKLSAKPSLAVKVDGREVDAAGSLPVAEGPPDGQVNEIGEQFSPLRIKWSSGGPGVIRNLWVGPIEPLQGASGKPWKPMFDDDSFEGWTVNGGDATYRREGDAIVGTTKHGTPNTFLITERDYGNFEFSVEVRGDVAFNAGIQFRSDARGGRGRRNRTFGYQCEIDPSPRAWSAGVYDEASRGWLTPLPYSPDRRTLLDKSRWHEFRIHAEGPVIKTYLDGKLVSHLYDSVSRRGYFGLQVHGTKVEEPMEIRWRNVRIRELD